MIGCTLSLLLTALSSIDHVGATTDDARWILSTDRFLPNQYQASPYVANGYFGQRLPAEGVGYWIYKDNTTGADLINSWPLDQPRATFGTISGFWNVQPNVTHAILPDNLKRGGESVISGIPDWTGLVVSTADGHVYQPGVNPTSVKAFSQSLSIQQGIVQTNITWKPASVTYHLNYSVVAHRARLNLGLVRLDLTVDQDVNLQITDILDGAGATRSTFFRKEMLDNASMWTSVKPNGIDYCTAYIASTVQLESQPPDAASLVAKSRHDGSHYSWVSTNASTIAQTWNVTLKQGVPFTVYKYVGIASTTIFPDDTLSVAQNVASAAKTVTWDELISEHSEKWDTLWDEADIEIPGNKDLQLRTRASLFHILSSLPPVGTEHDVAQNSISVGGLSSDSYAGLIFWDADTWIYPSVLALYPEYAATVNRYREAKLEQATKNAQYYNFSGALYPWTSGRFGNCTGTGVCKGYQYHLNTDIAQAHWQYFLHTKNTSWLAEKGWPVIKGVADMFAAFVLRNASSGLYETKQVAEPDEFAYNINNGAFTNAAIRMLLGVWAPTAAKFLDIEVPSNWSDIAEHMYLPLNDDRSIVLEFDGMNGAWQTKQASVALIQYPLGYHISEEQARDNADYYSLTNTENGPAMTWSIYAVAEAQLQQEGCAAHTYLERSSEPYMRAPFYQFSEALRDSELPGVNNPAFIFGLNPAFPFLTGAGGFLQVFTHGLTGMRPDLDVLYFDPMLPPQLPDGVNVKGIRWQDAVFDVSIGSKETKITRHITGKQEDDREAPIRVLGGLSEPKNYTLHGGQSIIVPTRRPDLINSKRNMALCKQVASDAEWAPGNYPSALVDGSNSTSWQASSARKASVEIDLGSVQNVSSIRVNWAATPALVLSVSGRQSPDDTFESMSRCKRVQISAPYNQKEAEQVKVRTGNVTDVQLSSTKKLRYLKLSVRGSYADDGLGATIAEVQVFGGSDL